LDLSQAWCFDFEANDLYLKADTIWYGRFKTLDGKRTLSVYPFKDGYEESARKVKEWIHSFDDGALVFGFNSLGYDLWLQWKLLGIIPRVGKGGKDWLDGKIIQNVDCYILSQYLNPDNKAHSLGYLSSGSENEKMAYRQKLIELGVMTGKEDKGHEFTFWHPLMAEYCDDDVDATIGVAFKLWKQAEDIYTKDKWIHPSFKQLQKDYWLYSAQAYTGSPFNLEKAKKLIEVAETEMEKIRLEVEPHLPPRPLKTAEENYYQIPAKPWKKDGTFSATFEKWMEKHNATINFDGKLEAYGFTIPIVAGELIPIKMPLEIDDNMELKQYFLDSGWQPSEDHWNFKKGADGKPERDGKGKVIKTTPKIAHQGKICPNLLTISGEIPSKVVKFLSYRNRLGIVKGWVSNWRIEFDGQLSSEISGYTPTFRVRHKTVVNCPKAAKEILLGAEMRDLFYAPEGYKYVGTDAAALENRTVASYTMKYDGGKFADLVLNGDSHSFNAFAFFPELHNKFDINDPTLKDNPEFKPWRNKSKTGSYLLAYGGGVTKLASSLGLTKQQAQIAYDNYFKANIGLGKLKENVEKYFDTTGKKKYLPAWDGRMLLARGKNVLINLAGQSCGAIAMSIAACIMDSKLGDFHLDTLGRPYYLYNGKIVKRTNLTHDEYSWIVEEGIEDTIRQFSVNAIIEAGKFMKLPLELDGEGKIGMSWMEVH